MIVDLSPVLYTRSQCAVFFLTQDDNGRLSNMAKGMPIRLDACKPRSSEALYQALKFPHRPDIQESILAAPTPKAAKLAAKAHRLFARTDWDECRIQVMDYIVEESHKDGFWGALPVGTGRGHEYLEGINALGKLLIRRRGLGMPDELPMPEFADAIMLGKPAKISPPAAPQPTLL